MWGLRRAIDRNRSERISFRPKEISFSFFNWHRDARALKLGFAGTALTPNKFSYAHAQGTLQHFSDQKKRRSSGQKKMKMTSSVTFLGEIKRNFREVQCIVEKLFFFPLKLLVSNNLLAHLRLKIDIKINNKWINKQIRREKIKTNKQHL